jgi:hypothetical protein
LEGSQDTMVFGPRVALELDKRFKDMLYGQIASMSIQKSVFRIFALDRSLLSLGYILPTTLTEESGRAGLMVSVGILCNRKLLIGHQSFIVNSLRGLVSALNAVFSISLLHGGADDLLTQIRNPSAQQEVYPKLEAVRDCMLPIACAFGGRTAGIGDRWRWLRSGRKRPKVILVGSDHGSIEDAIGIFLLETSRSIDKEGYTLLQDSGKELTKGLVMLAPLAELGLDASDATLRRFGDRTYVCIY